MKTTLRKIKFAAATVLMIASISAATYGSAEAKATVSGTVFCC